MTAASRPLVDRVEDEARVRRVTVGLENRVGEGVDHGVRLLLDPVGVGRDRVTDRLECAVESVVVVGVKATTAHFDRRRERLVE